MVEPDLADPLATVRMVRTYLQGPQDLSFTDTANVAGVAMRTGLRGRSLVPETALDRLLRRPPSSPPPRPNPAVSGAADRQRAGETLRSPATTEPPAPPLPTMTAS